MHSKYERCFLHDIATDIAYYTVIESKQAFSQPDKNNVGKLQQAQEEEVKLLKRLSYISFEILIFCDCDTNSNTHTASGESAKRCLLL